MRGVITIRDVLLNFGVVLREFGPRCLGRCLLASVKRQKTTFLEVAFRKGIR